MPLGPFLYAASTVYGLAVDPNEEKVYISDYGNQKIVVTNLDGSESTTLKSPRGGPQSLVVDFNKR